MSVRRGALYIRVSTQEQTELSPGSQKRLLLDYARDHEITVEPCHIFTESISGRQACKRPQFLQMIALAKKHAFDVILVWKFSRFARNQEESIVYKSMLKRDRIDVISISEPLTADPFGSLMERIIEWMDEYYSIRLSGDVSRGMTEKARRGGFQSRPPLGYRIPYPGGLPEPVPEEAALISHIFSRYTLEGASPLQIARELNESGMKTASGGAFESRSVRYILKNPMYAGILRWGSNGKSGPPVIRNGNFPPLVSTDLFDKAQKLLQDSQHPGNKIARPGKHWLSGLVKCSSCGRSLAFSSRKSPSGKTYSSFQCWGYLKGKCRISHQISEKKLTETVLTSLSRVLMTDLFSFFPNPEAPAPVSPDHFASSQLMILQKKKRRARDAYLKGADSLDEYLETCRSLETEEAMLTRRFGTVPDRSCRQKAPENISGSLTDLLVSQDVGTDTKHRLLSSVLSRIIYHSETHQLEFFYRGCLPSYQKDDPMGIQGSGGPGIFTH